MTPNIGVLELRNYLLKPQSSEAFRHYFNKHFVGPMQDLGGMTLGQFKVKAIDDRFVWLRGFQDMPTRSKFLNDFYRNSETWQTFGPGANELMINSDHVHLLRPLHPDSRPYGPFTVVDFYICNSTRDKVVKLFEDSYIPSLKNAQIDHVSMWVSEMTANDFPRLPVFQDQNLIVMITSYQNEADFQAKYKAMDAPELITTQSHLILMQHELDIPPLKFAADGALVITPSASSSPHDFDFFEGHSTTHNRRLKTRLNHCQEWLEFASQGTMNKFIGGKGNVDNYIAEFDGQPFEGMTVRLFDPKTSLWSIFWADSNEGKFGQPVVGSFENSVGHFFCRDTFQGKDIIVVFRWDARDKESPVWSQAFSDDLGKTWEWNWYMFMRKTAKADRVAGSLAEVPIKTRSNW